MKIKLSGLLAALLLTSGCAEFDKSRIPLYDEVLMPKEEADKPPRKSPAKNPLIMPPGYQQPQFNKYEGDENARLKGILESDRETQLNTKEAQPGLNYPKLSSVPPRPDMKGVSDNIGDSVADLEAERERALQIQQAIREGTMPVADTMPPDLPERGQDTALSSLPWGGEEGGEAPQESLRQPVRPITFADGEGRDVQMHPEYEDSYGDAPPPADAEHALLEGMKQEATHEFGAPEPVREGEHSNVTHMYQVGYDSQKQMEEDQEQFRLKPFEYSNVPRINAPGVEKEAAVTFNEVREPPSFLPESRYRARRVSGPYYRTSYHGSTYFKNQY